MPEGKQGGAKGNGRGAQEISGHRGFMAINPHTTVRKVVSLPRLLLSRSKTTGTHRN